MVDTHYIERERDDAGAMGWFIALILLLAIGIGGVIWYQQGTPGIPNTGTESTVTVPNASVPTGPDTSVPTGSGVTY